MPPNIPLIDFAAFRSDAPNAAADTGRKLFEAFRDVGFVYIRGHGVPQRTVDEAFRRHWADGAEREILGLPQEVKDTVPHPPDAWWHRRYSGIGLEKVSQEFDADALERLRDTPDVKESFEMGRETDLTLRNIWLTESTLPGFRDFFNRFYEVCYELELEILRALALGMGIDEYFFDSFHQAADNQTRILHYPAIDESIICSGKRERIGAYSDFDTITLLFQDEVGGLEVEDPHDQHRFTPVPFIPGTIVVNIGDFMMRWSNDILRSTMHRIRAPPTSSNADRKVIPDRYSIDPLLLRC